MAQPPSFDAEKAIRDKIAAEYEARLAREREEAARKEQALKAAADQAQRDKERLEEKQRADMAEMEAKMKQLQSAFVFVLSLTSFRSGGTAKG